MSLFVNSGKAVPPELESMVGMPLEPAVEAATKRGLIVRLVEVDGEPYSLESTFCEERINFKVEKGLVVEVGMG